MSIPTDYRFHSSCMIDAVWELVKLYPRDEELRLIQNELIVSTSETVDWLLAMVTDGPVSFAEGSIRERYLAIKRARTSVVTPNVHALRKPY